MPLYFDIVQPYRKNSLQTFVSSEDDLGPEIILNLKWLDAYRYQQIGAYHYYDLVQNIKERFSWDRILSNPKEESFNGANGALTDVLFEKTIIFEANIDGWDPFPT